jgi:hypothetical protein
VAEPSPPAEVAAKAPAEAPAVISSPAPQLRKIERSAQVI